MATVSCDKVKSLAAKVSATVKEQAAAKGSAAKGPSGGSSNKADAELQKLVDQTAEGVLFRKDLPFPTRLEVRKTSRTEFSGRMFHASEISKGTALMKGTELTISKFELKDDELVYSVEKSSFTPPVVDSPGTDKKKADEPVEQVAPPEVPVTFSRSGKTWRPAHSSDFRVAARAQKLVPEFDGLLVDGAVVPRPLWFAAHHRFKVGDQLTVGGESLPMVITGKVTGSCALKLEAFEAVEGHPCAVFSLTGNYRRKSPGPGSANDRDITIESGKIWCSLIYPVILKGEINNIQSEKAGGKGNPTTRYQGAVKISESIAWKRLP